MAKYRCPCCGAAYDGKRCGQCFYQPFTEEIAHGNHVHEGEPLVVNAPVRQPIPRKDPFGCEKKTKKKSRLPLILLVVILLSFLSPILTFAFYAVSEVTDMVSSFTGEPEPEVTVPEDGLVLMEEGGISVIADWQDGDAWEEGFRVYVRNETDQDIAVTAQDILINGYLMEISHLYCSAEAGSTGVSRLYLSDTDLRNAGIEDVRNISFWLDVYDTDSYETVAKSDAIALTASVPEDAVLWAEPEGIPVFDQEEIRVRYLGYSPDEYYPDDVTEGTLLFYLENTTDRFLYFDASDMTVNGESTSMSLWCGLPAQSRCVTTVYLYSLEDLDIREISDIRELSFQLEIFDPEDYDFTICADPVTLPGQ